MHLTNKLLQKTLDELEYLKKYYRKNCSVEKKPFGKAYDAKLRSELKAVIQRINSDVDKAAEYIALIDGKPGRPPKDRVLLTKLHLLQVLFDLDNREMECFSMLFILSGEESFSYKTIERAYEDPIVAMLLHNLFVLSAGEPREIDASADGTGIGLFISKYYRKDREQDLKKEKDSHDRKGYLFSVAIVDIDTNLYVGYAAGFKSEKALFEEANNLLKAMGFKLKSTTLDKYYSYQSIFEQFDENTRVVVLPKKNATIKGPKRWKQLLQDFITAPLSFLKGYYRREKSEANFSRDKRAHGKIRQRKTTRITTAAFSRAILHNYSMKHLYG